MISLHCEDRCTFMSPPPLVLWFWFAYRNMAARQLSLQISHLYVFFNILLKSQEIHLIRNFWIKIDQFDVTCFIISPFTAQHVLNVSTSIFRSLRLAVDLFRVLYCSGSMCVGVMVWLGWGGVVSLYRLKHCSVIKMMHSPINLRFLKIFDYVP